MLGGDGMDSYTQVPAARCAWGMWPCHVISGSKCHRFLRPRRIVKSMRYKKLLGGVDECTGPSQVRKEGRSGRQVAKSFLATSTIMRKRDGVDYFWF
jgi:hypothetical protein